MTKAVNACGSLADLKTVWGAMSEADRKVMQDLLFQNERNRYVEPRSKRSTDHRLVCGSKRPNSSIPYLETKELEEVITRCMEIQKEAFHLQEWAMSALDMEYVKWVESKKHKLARLMD
jgi:hypothetical protein